MAGSVLAFPGEDPVFPLLRKGGRYNGRASACIAAFYTVPHVAQRINRFLDPASGDTFNIDIATKSFIRGGWFGRGPGEGTIKRTPA